MITIEYEGRRYYTVSANDGKRDGMFLELRDESHTMLADVFYSDEDGSFVMTGFGGALPLEVIERFVAAARRFLPRVPDA